MSHILEVDLCVIGAGSGGLSVAAGAAQMGDKSGRTLPIGVSSGDISIRLKGNSR
jgi:succinate dehydrogenase/fumarate reductase flavoprotein subunit